MDDRTFEALRHLVLDESGIALGPGKRDLVAHRLSRRIAELGLADEAAYFAFIRADPTGGELGRLLDALATNVSGFLRDPEQFEVLGRFLAGRLAEGAPRIRIWSAACATGEEAWSLALVVAETPGADAADVRILATDLSGGALERAQAGVYEAERLEPIDPVRRERWFRERPDGRWEVGGALRARVLFRRLNLSKPPFPMKGPLDAILCRNVMIYLDPDVRQALLAEFQRLLAPGGLLFVGSAETVSGGRPPARLSRVAPSIYALGEAAR